MVNCNVCEVSDKQKKILIKSFSNEIYPIIEKHSEKIPIPALAAYLIHSAKELMCRYGNDYYLILGILTDMVQDDLQELFESHQEKKQKEK
jgi:hypothetical protein